MDESFKLDERRHQEIYRRIEKEVFGETKPVEHPRVIITGGQPGSGKSKLLEISKEQFPDGNVVVINGDDLRNYHPRRQQIQKEDDKKFAEKTDPDSREWTRKLFDRAIETKRNIVFESTMREAGPISKTMERLRKDGYHLTAKVVATHERMSTTGIFRRYEEQKAEKGYGRWSELSSHDAGYEGMPKTVGYIEKHGLVDQLEVYNRAGVLLYSNETSGRQWKKGPRAVEVIEAERQREPTEKERNNFRSDWQRIAELMEDRKAPLIERENARAVYEKLDRVMNKKRESAKSKESVKAEAKPASILKSKLERFKEAHKERGREDNLLP
ncbi:MAG: AAA family ATPase [Candidatus Competibacteraceae bacterium]|nr:AAA family ATPase [Candidatus Competibacteraceae bacterium]